MRTATEVDEIALAVERDLLPSRNALDDLSLVVLAHGIEKAHRGISIHEFPRDGLISGRELPHLVLNGSEVLEGQRSLIGEIIVKPVLNDWPDGDLKVGKEALGSVGQQVGCGVTNDVKTVGVLVSHDCELGILGDDVRCVDQLPVEAPGQGSLCETRSDARSHGRNRDGRVERSNRLIWEGDVDH